MNKAELISAMAAECGMTKTECGKALNAFLSVATETFKKGEKLTLVGFGTFLITNKAARVGVNPTTKQRIQIPAKKMVRFKPGTELALE